MSSNNTKKSRKKKLNQENESISTFIDKKSSETDEPLTKKNKLAEDSSADDSLKFFKNVQTKIKSVKPSTSNSSNAVSDFINKPSTSKQAKKAQQPKTKRNTKAKAQTDIRKALSKQDRLLYHAINESCTEDGVDPYEMQLALAISESLKDINKDEQSSKEQQEENKNLDNPFTSAGKIQSITTVLERYGFKSKKVYSDYEIEMIMNNKSSKRSKYQKFPTLLTSTNEDKRNEMIRSKIQDVLESTLFEEIQYKDVPKFDPIVYSDYLESHYEKHNTIISKSDTDKMVLNDYYVTDLFEPSNVKAGHLLKEWSKIVGRDSSPVTEIANRKKSLDIQEPEEMEIENISKECEDAAKVVSLNSSCSDIFEGVESFTLDQSENSQENVMNKSVNEHLNLLHEKLSQSVMAPENQMEINTYDNGLKNMDSIDLTKDDSIQSDATQEYNLPDEENEIFDQTQQKDWNNEVNSEQPEEHYENGNDEIFDLTQYESPKQDSIMNGAEMVESSQLQKYSTDQDVFDLTQQENLKESEIIDISDEEINYSINRFQANDEIGENYSNNCMSQSEGSSNDVMEIDNIADHSLIEVISNDDFLKIDNSVSELLTNFSDYRKSTANYTRKNRSMRLIENEIFNDSITDIMKKYGVVNSPAASKNKSFDKIHSESDLEKLSQHSAEEINENVDLTIMNDKSIVENDSIIEEIEEDNLPDMNLSINKSLANILKSPMIKENATLSKPKPRKSLGIVLNEKYVIDTENLFIEPDFSNMTPLELKQELFKYGIRSLPVKKAVELLKHIYDQIHPKIRIAMDEEIDLDDTRRAMNITDVITDIGMKGDEDEFVFQLNDCGILEDEEYILPKMKKSKVPSCLIPLHISFYNMIRSNDKLQKYILEYRPLDLDQIYKHFRKFDLTYQLNDIIAFLDKRCITFKTKEQSYSKKHERKKQKRTQSQ